MCSLFEPGIYSSGSTACKLKRAARRNILRNDVDGMPPTFARGALGGLRNAALIVEQHAVRERQRAGVKIHVSASAPFALDPPNITIPSE
jgi:hypothetical protein